jgi:type VI secretion system protein ImpF
VSRTRAAKNDRFVPPIMHAFREAFRVRDSAKPIDRQNEAGERIIAGRRTTPRSAVGEAALRQQLGEDLSSLLNTIDLGAIEDLADLDHVGKSILNFGVPDLGGITASEESGPELARLLREKFEQHECRLVSGTVRVQFEPQADDASGLVKLHINAEMRSTPADVPIEFVAEVDTESGKIRVANI